ncbi:MAG TPA: TonB-dependent receptor [Bacteroidia bacterium]|nr:TonB-dependent receptor [Bacteroidia bacterium]
MKKLIWLVLSVGTFSCFGQKLKINLQTGNADPNACKNAVIHVDGNLVFPDSNATCEFMLHKPGMHQLNVQLMGYRHYHAEIQVLHDTLIMIQLRPEEISLEEVTVEGGPKQTFAIAWLQPVEGAVIYAGKKSESVKLEELGTNLSANTGRQLFSRVPGINVQESEGSGVNVSVGGRGLSPGRMASFNVRQNGYDISADPLGYPESYYTPPAEAIERIDIMRGASSLQYGSQFGGMINYRFRAPDSKPISGNFRQTLGSFGMFNSFNQLSGTKGALSYNTFYQYKQYTGWRDNSQLNGHTAYAALYFKASEKLTLRGEYTYMTYLNKQPGGMSDAQFQSDPSISTRSRNWFQLGWNLASVGADYKISKQTSVNVLGYTIQSLRQSLAYTGKPDGPDDLNANRSLSKDAYSNYGAEVRVLHNYKLSGHSDHLVFGGKVYNGATHRQQGDGSKSSDPDFVFLNPDNLESSDYNFPITNYAIFAENIFQITSKWSIVPGVRFEYIHTAADGYYRLINKNSSGSVILDTKVYESKASNRSFFLAGLGTQYNLSKDMELYGNISQNYRAINFNDMRVTNPNAKVDPNLKDESGYTADGGFRGKPGQFLYFDVSVFSIFYNNRIGSVSYFDSLSKQTVSYRTNIGYSQNNGVEALAELDWMKLANPSTTQKLSTFLNVSYIQAIYHTDKSTYNGNKVEYVPDWILRTGINYAYKAISFAVLYSYTARQFSDAGNTTVVTNGLSGIIPSFSVLDFSGQYKWKRFTLIAGINNMLNAKYFTRRSSGIPGPGIIPADPVNVYCTLGFRF